MKKDDGICQKVSSDFIGLLLMLRGLLWVVDGKKGNKRSLSLGLAAIVVGIIMFITVFFETL